MESMERLTDDEKKSMAYAVIVESIKRNREEWKDDCTCQDRLINESISAEIIFIGSNIVWLKIGELKFCYDFWKAQELEKLLGLNDLLIYNISDYTMRRY